MNIFRRNLLKSLVLLPFCKKLFNPIRIHSFDGSPLSRHEFEPYCQLFRKYGMKIPPGAKIGPYVTIVHPETKKDYQVHITKFVEHENRRSIKVDQLMYGWPNGEIPSVWTRVEILS